MNIGVFFGSRSPEHDVSIITAQLIISGLRGLGYTVVPVYLSKEGEWLLGEDLGDLKTFTDPKRQIEPRRHRRYYLDLEESRGQIVFRKKGLWGKEIIIDLAFPAFHGSYGEDGTVQGLFEMFGIAYVGCDVTSSALTMDKVLTKLLYQAYQIPTTKFLSFSESKWQENSGEILRQIREELHGPVFVKPARLGSSIGIAKVADKNTKDLEYRIEVAQHYDPKVLVEEAVENLVDITCSVIGNEEAQPSLLQESRFDSEFFGFEEKYLKGGGAQLGKAQNKIIIPARLDEKVTGEIRALAVKIFRLFGCSGIARVDFLFDRQTGKYYANEINTLPGTLYHHLWKKSGIEFGELLEKLIGFAQSRSAVRKKHISSFESDILRQASPIKFGWRPDGFSE